MVIVCKSKSLAMTRKLSAKFYKCLKFYRKILYRTFRLLKTPFPNSFGKLLTFRNEHVDLGVKEEDMQKTEAMPTHNAAGN